MLITGKVLLELHPRNPSQVPQYPAPVPPGVEDTAWECPYQIPPLMYSANQIVKPIITNITMFRVQQNYPVRDGMSTLWGMLQSILKLYKLNLLLVEPQLLKVRDPVLRI